MKICARYLTLFVCLLGNCEGFRDRGQLIAAGRESLAETTAPPEVTPAESGEYTQQVHVGHSLAQGLPSVQINSIAIAGDAVFAATQSGLACFRDGAWNVVGKITSPISGLTSGRGRIWYVEGSSVYSHTQDAAVKLEFHVPASLSVHCLLVTDDNVFVGTNAGLYELASGQLQPVGAVNQELTDGLAIRQLAGHGLEIAVAAAGGLVTMDTKSGTATSLTPRASQVGWALQDVRGVAYTPSGALWFASPQGVGKRSHDGWQLYTGYEGLPWNDFTCMAAGASGEVWFGTKLGAIRFAGDTWEYRQGKRWLLDDHVNAIAVSDKGDAWFATPAGVSCIEARTMTLQRKAAMFNEDIDRFHKRTEYGYVDAVSLKQPGDLTEWTQHDSDNDGLWTSMYGAAQCFEYAVTHSAASKKRADAAFRAVAFLSEVPQGGKESPPHGFPARTILPVSGRNPNLHDNPDHDRRRQMFDPLWKVITPRWPVSADGQWYWKTDTSSDELDGHYFFYAVYYDLVAETDQEKERVREVVDRITTHLVTHNYALIDHDGLPTRWGQFAPDVLNTDHLTDCRGLNSVSILSYLKAAQHITGNEKYDVAYRKLLHEHNYFTNVLVPKNQNGPGSGNQSDDEMAFMCYYNLFSYEHDPALRKQYMRSMARYFAQEQPEICPLFNFIFAEFYEPLRHYWPAVPQEIIVDAFDTLQRFPVDRVRWGHKNSHRLDIIPLGKHVVESEGKGYRRNGKVLPIDERFVNHWNHDPWRLDEGGGGTEMADGVAFLLPYWMGVYHGFVKEMSSPAAQ
ncbi:MAG: hypothetical protein R3C17_21420 [Planctomycetaceae bacterium]